MGKTLTAQRVLADNCARLRGDLSQADVAARARRAGFDVDQKTISRLENPESANSTIKTVEAVSAALNVPLWKLLLPEAVVQLPHDHCPKVRKICAIAESLNEDGLTALLAQAEFLSNSPQYNTKSKQRKS